MMTAGQIAARCQEAELRGDAGATVTRVSAVAGAGAGDLVFAESSAAFAEALQGAAGVVLAPLACRGDAAESESRRTVVFVAQPRLEFARAAALLRAGSTHMPGIHASATLGRGVVCGEGVAVGAGAVLEDDVRLGDGVSVGAHCVVMAGCVIGDGTRLYARVTVYPGARIGARCVVHAGAVLGADGFGYVRDPASGSYTQFPQQGRLVIGDDVEIGANTTVDRGALEDTVIGDGCKLDNLVHVGHNVRIGRNVVIAAQTGISGSSVIGDGAVIAGQVGIADHVTIGDGVILGAQCGVPSGKKITGAGVLFWGTPARPIQQYLKELATLARSVRKRETS